jgi:predicted Fe-Mo cluster-binding NifX family protein
VDAIVVGGIGAGALNKLQQLGIDVYRAQKRTVRDNLELFKAQALVRMSVQHTCAGHGAGGGCSHS